MDLGTEASALESVDDNHVIHHSDDDHDGSNSYKDHNGTSSPNHHHSTGVELVQNSPPARKGYGLKKWRRIKRSSPNHNAPAEPEAEAEEDNGKVLKRRGFSSASIPPAKPSQSSSLEINRNALGFGQTMNVLNDVGHSESGSSLDSRFAFGAPSDSENSEGRNSRSSTAASAPKAVMHASPVVLGHGRMKNLVAKNAGNSNQKAHSGKSVAAENNKKQRGSKIDKEYSLSSLESDSRSSNFVFTKGVSSSATSNGRSKNYCGDNRDEALFGDEVQTAFRKEDVDETEEVNDLTKDSSWKDKKGKGENHHGSPVHDSLTESIRALQSVQEALEKEVHNLGEVGKESVSLHANSVIENGVSLETTDWLASEEKASSALENQVFALTQKVNFLESRLEEAKAAIELKDTQVSELEATINSPKSTKEESGSSVALQEMESEFEGLFLQKLEAEIEYLAISKATEKLRIAATDHRKLFEEQKSIMSNQGQVLTHLGEAEQKAAVVKKQVERIEQYCGDIIGTEETLKMQRRACKLTFSFFIQLILLLLVFLFVVLESSYPQSGVIVPT